MNKLYLIALLGLAVKADMGSDSGSNGWLAGDCLDDTSFDTTYGYVELDCGTTCGVTDNGTDGEGEDYYMNLYGDCFADDRDMELEFTCVAYSLVCAIYGVDSCVSDVAACGDEDCMISAVCYGDETCIGEVTTAVSSWESSNTWSDSDDSSRKIRKLKGKSLTDLPIVNGIVLYGLDTIDSSYPAYCDHYHLYSFGFDSVTPQGSSDSSSDLTVMGWSMIGFPGLCSYSSGLGISSEFSAGAEIATTGD